MNPEVGISFIRPPQSQQNMVAAARHGRDHRRICRLHGNQRLRLFMTGATLYNGTVYSLASSNPRMVRTGCFAPSAVRLVIVMVTG